MALECSLWVAHTEVVAFEQKILMHAQVSAEFDEILHVIPREETPSCCILKTSSI